MFNEKNKRRVRGEESIYQLVHIEGQNRDREKDNDNNIHYLDFHIEHYENRIYIQLHLKIFFLVKIILKKNKEIPGGIVVVDGDVACSR